MENSNFAEFNIEDFFDENVKTSNIFYNKFNEMPTEISNFTDGEKEYSLVYYDGYLVYDNLPVETSIYASDLSSALDEFPNKVIKIKENFVNNVKITKQVSESISNSDSGFVIIVPKSIKFAEKLNIFTINSKSSFVSNYIYLEENSNLNIVHYSNSRDIEFASNLTEVFLEKNSNLNYTFVNTYKSDVRAYNPLRVLQNESSTFDFTNIALNYKTYFSDLFVSLVGKNSSFDYKSLSLLSNKTINNTNIEVTHLAENTRSSIENQIIVNSRSQATCNVISKIEKDMKGSDASQKTIGLVLSDNATVSANPLLLIDCNDVKASHGASIGRFSDEDLFYLMSRGIDKLEAQKLIISGVIAPYMEKLDFDYLKNACLLIINEYLGD